MALPTHLCSRTTLSTLALLLCSTVALAGPNEHHRGRGGGLFARLDQNGDGKIERAEARSAAAKHFAEMDANGDGALTREEPMGGKHAQSGHAKRTGEHFARMDKNSDGKVDRTETRMPQAAFTAADTNKDGKLTREELQASFDAMSEARRAERFAEFDANKDGKVTRAEALAHADRRFATLDADKDGAVTRQEAHAALPKRHGHDAPGRDCRHGSGKTTSNSAEEPGKGQAI